MENGKVDTLVFAIVDGVVVDQNGKEVKCTPYHKKVLLEKGGCFKLTQGASGMRFAHMDRKVFEDLRASAKPLTDTYNVKALDVDVTSFVNASYSMKPDTLIMDELKWKYLMRSVVRGKNIMMTGPSGCGKTLAVQSVAKAMETFPVTVVVDEAELAEMRRAPTFNIIKVEEV